MGRARKPNEKAPLIVCESKSLRHIEKVVNPDAYAPEWAIWCLETLSGNIKKQLVEATNFAKQVGTLQGL